MSKELIVNNKRLPSTTEPRNITVNNKANYFENVEHLTLEQNINVSTTVNGNTITSNLKPDNSFYNLFVLEDEEFAKGYFIIGKDRCLKHLDTSIKNNYSLINNDSINKCLKYPCLFVNKNKEDYKKAANDQNAFFGYLTKIEIIEGACKFFFSIVSSLNQNIFNKNATAFNIKVSSGENELDKVHWSIKKVNLVEKIRSLGYNVASY